jgi:hypothetical protein
MFSQAAKGKPLVVAYVGIVYHYITAASESETTKGLH